MFSVCYRIVVLVGKWPDIHAHDTDKQGDF